MSPDTFGDTFHFQLLFALLLFVATVARRRRPQPRRWASFVVGIKNKVVINLMGNTRFLRFVRSFVLLFHIFHAVEVVGVVIVAVAVAVHIFCVFFFYVFLSGNLPANLLRVRVRRSFIECVQA